MTIERALDAVAAGAIGDVVAVELQRGFAYPPYEGGPLPPWYRDAGHPFRDAGAPGLALIHALLGPIEQVDATWRSVGDAPDLVFDDWRAMVRCARGLGELQLTWSAAPAQRIVIRGTAGVLTVPGTVERLVDRVRRLVRAPAPPVAAEVTAEVTRWVEQVARAAEQDHAERLARLAVAPTTPFLVTGGSGALGGAVVRRLLAEGQRVRALVRRIPGAPLAGVDYVVGNLGDPEAVDRAVAGAETVIHAGAAMKGGWPEHHAGTVVGTRNVIDSALRHRVRQLVHISSMSVVDWAGSSGGAPVSEATALEPRADERGAYTRAKLEAERVVGDAVAARGLPAVILRPGQIFGGGVPLVNGAVARRAGGRWLVLGDGTLTLPLVYIDDVVDAIRAAIDRRLTGGEVIQIIDPEPLSQAQVLSLAGGAAPILKVPRALVFALGALSEYPLAALGRRSPVARYRLASALARLRFASDRAEAVLGWRPRVGVREGIRREARPDTVPG